LGQEVAVLRDGSRNGGQMQEGDAKQRVGHQCQGTINLCAGAVWCGV
jgi:hypothetical protein